MIDTVLGLLHNGLTFLFGIYISAAFLGIRMNRRNVLILLAFSSAVGVVFASSFVLFGAKVTQQIYPLIIHIPLILFLTLFYHYKAILAVLSVLTAYLCCQISNWIGLLALNLTHLDWVYFSTRIVTTVLVFILLLRFVSDAVAQLMQKPTKTLLIFGMLPFVYYLYDYAAKVYTSLLYSGSTVVVEFLAFALCVFYILFLVVYFKQYEEKQETEQRSRILEMKQAQAEKEIEAFQQTQHAVALLRHDMRHFLLNITAFIEEDEKEKALAYIHEIIAATDKTTTQKYCKNEIVNRILSSYEHRIRENGIRFEYSIQIPEKLPVCDVDLTSILSNALENAVHAAAIVEPENRQIQLNLGMNGNKLLISLKNTCAEVPKMVDGLPQSSQKGHGLGTQSIRYVTEKLNGNCQFTVQDHWFLLRVIL